MARYGPPSAGMRSFMIANAGLWDAEISQVVVCRFLVPEESPCRYPLKKCRGDADQRLFYIDKE